MSATQITAAPGIPQIVITRRCILSPSALANRSSQTECTSRWPAPRRTSPEWSGPLTVRPREKRGRHRRQPPPGSSNDERATGGASPMRYQRVAPALVDDTGIVWVGRSGHDGLST